MEIKIWCSHCHGTGFLDNKDPNDWEVSCHFCEGSSIEIIEDSCVENIEQATEKYGDSIVGRTLGKRMAHCKKIKALADASQNLIRKIQKTL